MRLLGPVLFFKLFADFSLAFCQFFVNIHTHSKRLSSFVFLFWVKSLYTLLAGVSTFFY
jgi:hypothetical protein